MILFEELTARHDLSRFRSGNSVLDSYLKREALARQKAGEVRVFVLIDTEEDEDRPLGYIALAATSAYVPTPHPESDAIPHETFQYLALVAFLARDISWRGRGLGEILLLEALRQCVQAAQCIGLPGVFLEATKDGAALYERFGFVRVEEGQSYMYLPMSKAQALVEFGE